MMNSNAVLGYGLDADAVYGPSAHRLIADKKESEPATVTDAPIDGPTNKSGAYVGNLKDVQTFLGSPVGLLLVLLPVAYLVFAKAFGRG